MRIAGAKIARLLAAALVVGLGVLTAGQGLAESPTIVKIKQRGKLRVGVAIAPPELMQDPKTGKYFGVNALIAQRIADKLGVGVEFVESDWGLFVAGLQAGKFDIVSTALFATPARLKVMDFVNFTKIGECYLVLKTNDKINTLADLNSPNVRIGVMTGTGAEQLIKAKYTRAVIDSVPGAPGQIERLQDVLARRIDASFLDSPMAPVYAAQFPQIKVIPGGPEGCVKNPDVPVDVGIGLNKGDPEFKAFVEGVVQGMRSEIDATIIKYSTGEYLKIPK